MIDIDLPKEGRYLVAVSFGPDSMALLNMLYERRYDVGVAHVNYHHRPASDLEQTGLEQYCLIRDIPIYVLDIPKKDITGNFQAWARTARYEFFKEIAAETGASGVVTAHHQDDHLETAVMQQKRKTRAIYMGISPNSTWSGLPIFRPLLKRTKMELLAYCDELKVPYAIDASNLSDDYERNRIRHHVIEAMTTADRRQLLAVIETHNNKMEAIKVRLTTPANEGKIPVAALEGYDEDELFVALHILLEKELTGFPISNHLIQEVRHAAASKRNYWKRHLRGNHWLIRNYGEIEVIKLDHVSGYSYVYDKPSKDETPYFYIDFTSGSHRDLVSLDDYPITVRNAKMGDAIIIKNKTRQLRRLFIDWKMPRHRRSSWPVIVGKDGRILFVPRHQKDFEPNATSRFYVK